MRTQIHANGPKLNQVSTVDLYANAQCCEDSESSMQDEYLEMFDGAQTSVHDTGNLEAS